MLGARSSAEWNGSNPFFFGEFADHRALSAVVADMLVSFIPGVVIVTSARDAVAVILRLANHPEKREDLMEWVLLCACMIVIALPIAMAAAGAAAAGVGAVVGGIAGTELGAALRAVMLMLIKEASKLVELVRFLQKFIKGDVLKFLRAIKFVKYEKALIQALSKISGKLVDIIKALRTHLETLRYFDAIGTTISKLAEWEKKFYNVQQDALRQIPKALTELDARLAKVLEQSAPTETHTVVAGVQAEKAMVTPPVVQRVRDTLGHALTESHGKRASATTEVEAKSKTKAISTVKSEAHPKPLAKDKPDPVKSPDEAANIKKQAVADAAVAADRERITRLSKEAREAERAGNKEVFKIKLKAARDILEPYLPKKPGDSWAPIIDRLDVSSPKDGAVFWSGTAYQAKITGQKDAARVFAEEIGGVTLETTSGGRIIDGWDRVNEGFPWNADYGPPPWASDLWGGVSEKYANAASGNINLIQTPNKLWDPTTIWHTQERPTLTYLQKIGQVDDINIHVVDAGSATHELSKAYIEQLMSFTQKP